MNTRASDYLDAIELLPDGATLVIHQSSWDDYERLLHDLRDRPHLRVTYDHGKLEIMSPLPEHEEYVRFIDAVVRFIADDLNLKLQNYGSATWRSQRLARGAEADSCYYVANAERVIGKRKFDLETDPPPDVVVELDITNESLSKFPIYAALGVREIWRYDGASVRFYELDGGNYRDLPESMSLPGLTTEMLHGALEQNKIEGQTDALDAFRRRWGSK